MDIIKTSEISGFYKLSIEERSKILQVFSSLTKDEIEILQKNLILEDANRMVENVVGVMQIPLGIATNFLINGKDYLIPMATEEPSVIAAASNAAKIARKNGGFRASASESIMIGQIQLTPNEDVNFLRKIILKNKEKILEIANSKDPSLVKFGGGAKDLEIRVVKAKSKEMLIVHLLVDCKDAMGANAVNTMCEAVAPFIEEITKEKTNLKIISNLADRRIAKAEVKIKKETLGGEEVVDSIVNAYEFAAADIYRAATHNKGVMNGITAIALATGNDTRAIEAGAHAYASISGSYRPITTWTKTEEGDLYGKIELPIAAGIVGGATSSKLARVCLKILNVKTAKELAMIMASVGLAQNFAALKALTTEGIQKGHMKLHAKNIAQMAGAKGNEIDKIAEIMIKENKINFERAKELLEQLLEH
ncbi:MAG: hydroxymethylglutaryl-CoA reductase, degradative [Candidatus Altiarchaeota archaeon]